MAIYGWGTQAYGTTPYGGLVDLSWTKITKATVTWTLVSKATDSWTKITKATL